MRGSRPIDQGYCVGAREILFIHPFREGNGRTARLLADMMALKQGFGKLAFERIEDRFEEYVNAVQRAAVDDRKPMEEIIRVVFPTPL